MIGGYRIAVHSEDGNGVDIPQVSMLHGYGPNTAATKEACKYSCLLAESVRWLLKLIIFEKEFVVLRQAFLDPYLP